jgi:hypothetical protein
LPAVAADAASSIDDARDILRVTVMTYIRIS